MLLGFNEAREPAHRRSRRMLDPAARAVRAARAAARAAGEAAAATGARAGVELALADQGVDLLICGHRSRRARRRSRRSPTSPQTHGLARLSIDGGLGPEAALGARAGDGDARRRRGRRCRRAASSRRPRTARRRCSRRCARRSATAKTVADLFAGLGTFALPLSRSARVLAAEGARERSCRSRRRRRAPGGRWSPIIATCSAGPIRRPSSSRFDAVVLDPPRAGRARAGRRARRGDVRADRLCLVQPRDLRARRADAGRRRLAAGVGQAGRPVPLVDACRAGGELRAVADHVPHPPPEQARRWLDVDAADDPGRRGSQGS